LFVWTNSSPNGFPEALIEGFIAALGNTDPIPVYTQVNDIVNSELINKISKITICDNGTNVDTGMFDGCYCNLIYGNLTIKNGSVFFGKAPEAQLKIHNYSIYFIWLSKYNIRYRCDIVKQSENVLLLKCWEYNISYERMEQ
jgi:hypothetical protein